MHGFAVAKKSRMLMDDRTVFFIGWLGSYLP